MAAEEEVETRKHDLREAQRRVAEQREAVLLQHREQQEKLQRQEAEIEQTRRQREALQALMQTSVQVRAGETCLILLLLLSFNKLLCVSFQPPPPAPGSTAELSEPIGQTRRKLLASLLRAIEESSGGSLSHLEEHPEREGSQSSQENIPGTSLHHTGRECQSCCNELSSCHPH